MLGLHSTIHWSQFNILVLFRRKKCFYVCFCSSSTENGLQVIWEILSITQPRNSIRTWMNVLYSWQCKRSSKAVQIFLEVLTLSLLISMFLPTNTDPSIRAIQKRENDSHKIIRKARTNMKEKEKSQNWFN